MPLQPHDLGAGSVCYSFCGCLRQRRAAPGKRRRARRGSGRVIHAEAAPGYGRRRPVQAPSPGLTGRRADSQRRAVFSQLVIYS